MTTSTDDREEQKQRNWAQWCEAAATSICYCRLCNWPLDASSINSLALAQRCQVCADMENTLYANAYWQKLDFKDYREKKSEAG